MKRYARWWNEACRLAADERAPDDTELEALLTAGVEDALSLEQANRLAHLLGRADFGQVQARVLEAGGRARRRVFGNRVAVMAPVEVSNRCASDCLFCGWRSSNPDIARLGISRELVLEQTAYLLDMGIDYIELVGGDDFGFVRRDLPALVRSVRDLMDNRGMRGRVCVCSMAVTDAHYADWKQMGVDAMFVWQETYDPACFERMVVGGPKAHGITDDWRVRRDSDGYRFRLESQERALQAGLEVGLGFMLGLGPHLYAELLMLLQHARHLLDVGGTGAGPLVIGMPTWNRITTPRTDNRPAGTLDAEQVFGFLAAVMFLALPKGPVWVFPNCRVSLETQVRAVETAGPFTSTEVKLGPGGYLPAAIRACEERGEDVGQLRHRIRTELGMDPLDMEAVGRRLDAGEQFRHHYHPHAAYTAAFEARGLRVCPFEELAAG